MVNISFYKIILRGGEQSRVETHRMFEYPIRRLIVRSCIISKPQVLNLDRMIALKFDRHIDSQQRFQDITRSYEKPSYATLSLDKLVSSGPGWRPDKMDDILKSTISD